MQIVPFVLFFVAALLLLLEHNILHDGTYLWEEEEER